MEIAFVFGIHLFFIFSTTVLIIIEHYSQKLQEAENRYQLSPIKQEIIYKTFDAQVLKTSALSSVFDTDSRVIKRIKEDLTYELQQSIKPSIEFEHFPPIDQPYERIEATLIIGVPRCNL